MRRGPPGGPEPPRARGRPGGPKNKILNLGPGPGHSRTWGYRGPAPGADKPDLRSAGAQPLCPERLRAALAACRERNK